MKKQEFDLENSQEESTFIPKQEFNLTQVDIEMNETDPREKHNKIIDETEPHFFNPHHSNMKKWKCLLISTALLFLTAVIAQTVQWLWHSWQQQQWISVVFALVALSTLVLGLTAMGQEWYKLKQLKKRYQLQQQSRQFSVPISLSTKQSAVDFSHDFTYSAEQGQQFAQSIAQAMKLNPQSTHIIKWQQQVQPTHSAQEVIYLFNQNVMQPIDEKAKKLIAQTALEAAVVVSISPLAVVDMFFIAWRNIRLINKIATLYGIELGYLSRLRLLRMVLTNIAFAGATEVIQDIGLDWLSQDLTAKVSSRVAQGIGVGLLTARLGIKAMEFCRPLTFNEQEKPRLNLIQKELLANLKSRILKSEKQYKTETHKSETY